MNKRQLKKFTKKNFVKIRKLAVNPNELLILEWDFEQSGLSEAVQFLNCLGELFPQVAMGIIPNKTSIRTMDKRHVAALIEKLKEAIKDESDE